MTSPHRTIRTPARTVSPTVRATSGRVASRAGRPPSRLTRAAPLAAALALGATLVACSPGSDDDRPLQALASFYPLQFVVEQVGGEHVEVTNLTPPAAEPHDLELSPAQVRSVGEADLVVYLSGFQAATDAAIASTAPAHAIDTADAAGLEGLDPHFWLDPTRLARVGQQVADELTAVDPDNAADYQAGADTLAASLDALDGEYAAGLATCAGATLVTSHEAFGYLAHRFDLHQVGISGINPDAEPSPARLREVRAVVEADGVQTLFFERAVSPKVTQTLADDLGVRTALLDPVESRADTDGDYLSIMRDNLAALEAGLTCS